MTLPKQRFTVSHERLARIAHVIVPDRTNNPKKWQEAFDGASNGYSHAANARGVTKTSLISKIDDSAYTKGFNAGVALYILGGNAGVENPFDNSNN